MLKEAADAGFYKPPGLEDRYPRIQILTIGLLAGKRGRLRRSRWHWAGRKIEEPF
jgi:hypothetical protein